MVIVDFALIDYRIKFGIICLLGIFLTIFCSLRSLGVSRDSYNYSLMFNQFNDYLDSIKAGVEPGFSVITTLLKKINLDSVNYLFFIFALLSVPIKIKIIYKYSQWPIISLLLFYSVLYFRQDFTQIRAAVAVAIYMWSIDDIFDKNFKRFIIKIILASCFHVSAIILFFTYFMSRSEINKRNYYYVLFGVFFAANLKLTQLLLKLPFFSILSRLQAYVEKASSGADSVFNPFGSLFLLQFVISLCSLYFIDTIKYNTKHGIFFVKLLIYGTIFIYLAGGVSVIIATRINDLFICTMCISYTYSIYYIRPKVFGVCLILLISILFYWYQIYHDQIMMPYSTWL